MDIKEFINQIEQEFEDIEQGTIQPKTLYKELEGWNSMMALIMIAKIDEVYKINITAEELANTFTISDLFNIVKSK